MDWNDDGKPDLVSGDSKGQVWVFLNTGTRKRPGLGRGQRVTADGKPIVGTRNKYEKAGKASRRVPQPGKLIGIYSKLHIRDFDGDGLFDLLIGQDSPGGEEIIWFKNTGKKGTPAFAAPQGVTLPGPGMSRPSPYLVDWDRDGTVDLLCGTEGRDVVFFRNKGTAAKPAWATGKKLELVGEGLAKGYRSRIDVTDWNNDGKLDLLLGNYASGGGNVWLFCGK